MENNDLFGNISKEDLEKYAKEAEEKWGHTEAYKQSQERVKKLGMFGMIKVAREQAAITKDIGNAMKAGEKPESEKVQKIIARHYESLRTFYEPNLELYRGLANMYISDPRFAENYNKIAPGLAEYMSKAMLYFVETAKK